MHKRNLSLRDRTTDGFHWPVPTQAATPCQNLNVVPCCLPNKWWFILLHLTNTSRFNKEQGLPSSTCWQISFWAPDPSQTGERSDEIPTWDVNPSQQIRSTVSNRWRWRIKHNWLVVWNPLKNISHLGWLFPIYGKIKNVPNHQWEYDFTYCHIIDIIHIKIGVSSGKMTIFTWHASRIPKRMDACKHFATRALWPLSECSTGPATTTLECAFGKGATVLSCTFGLERYNSEVYAKFWWFVTIWSKSIAFEIVTCIILKLNHGEILAIKHSKVMVKQDTHRTFTAENLISSDTTC